MKFCKHICMLMAIVIVACSLQIVSFATEVVELDGERTVFLGTFGRVNYNGKSYKSFKTFNEAFSALGKEGGRIVLSGNITVGEFNDIDGRNPVTLVGVGANAMGNLVDFSDNPNISLKGDLALGNINIKCAADSFIFTNGHKLTTFENFDTFHTIKYVSDGDDIVTYSNRPSITTGTTTADSAFSLTDGHYLSIIAGAIENHTTQGTSIAVIDNGSVQSAVAGTSGGVSNGTTRLIINGGEIDSVIAGSVSGTINGDCYTEINGGTVTTLEFGAAGNAVINGNLIIAFNGGNVYNLKMASGKVTGSKITILNDKAGLTLPAGFSDYVIKIENGFCQPLSSNGALTGFKITDNYGIPATEVTVNGASKTSENGIYSLEKGENKISVPTKINLELKKDAKYVSGYEDGSFRPQNNMTKAEAITLLCRLLVDENYIKGHISSNYIDVEDGAWYESYIGLFEKLGFLENIHLDYGLKIAPNSLITRGEFTELIYAVSSYASGSASIKNRYFSDVAYSNKFINAISYAVSAGIVGGYDDGSFRPNNNITRAEVVTMVNRLLERTPTGNAGANNFNDISTHWAKDQVLAACNNENESWTPKSASAKEYQLTGTTTKEYVTALYEQSASLDAEAIRRGVQTISDRVKQDILSTPNVDVSDKYKTIYYISEKNGNDENDGLSPEKPFKTLAALNKIKFLRNASVLFERGGIYRGQLIINSNMYVGAYGTGDKPLLMQSKKNYADESLWEATEYPNVYVCKDLIVNAGVIGFDHDLFDYTDASYDEKYGYIMNKGLAGFTGIKDMNKDLQFYSEFVNDDISKPGKLYLYSTEGNPGKRFKSIEIGERFDIIDGQPVNVVVENLAFKFTGAHAIGINNARNFTVKNCVFSWLGGSMLTLDFYGRGPVNYGNAIETGQCNGYYLEDNWMYQIYDTGVTHQCSKGSGVRTQKDVRYTGNLIEYVHWGIEFYNSPEGKVANEERITDGVYTAFNICRYGGYGWGSIVRNRTNSAQLYCGHSLDENKNQLTEYNIFDRCGGYLLVLPSNSTEVQDKNIYIQTIGKHLGTLRGKYVKCDYDASERITKDWGDKNPVVILIDPKKEDPDSYFK